MPKPLRFGLIGLGLHGSRYAHHLLNDEIAGASLVACSRKNTVEGKRWAEERNLKFHHETEDLIRNPDVDAVILVLPPGLHAQSAAQCIEAHKPVLIEKPVTATLPQALTLLHSKNSKGAFLSVAHTLRYDSLVLKMKSLLPKLGTLHTIYLNQRFEPFHREWIDDLDHGGLWINTVVHGIDLIQWLTGSAFQSISAMDDKIQTTQTEDRCAFWGKLTSEPTIALLENNRLTDGRSGTIELAGSKGQLVGDHIHRTLRGIRGRNFEELPTVPANPTIIATLQDFVDSLKMDREPPIPLEQAVETMRVIEAAKQSTKSGRVIALDEIEQP